MQGVEEQGVRRTLLYAAMTRDEDNEADGDFSAACKRKTSDFIQAAQKLHMQGVEEQGVRRTLLYAAITRDEDNEWVFSNLQAENL